MWHQCVEAVYEEASRQGALRHHALCLDDAFDDGIGMVDDGGRRGLFRHPIGALVCEVRCSRRPPAAEPVFD